MSSPLTNINSLKNKMTTGFQRSSIGYILLMVIILGTALFIWYSYSKKNADINSRLNPIFISSPVQATDSGLSSNAYDLPQDNPYGLQYTYSFWMNVHDLIYRQTDDKIIFKVSDGTDLNPQVSIPVSTNDLEFSFKNAGEDIKIITISDIPIMRWVYVNVVLNNRNVDIYLDGKLESSTILDSVPNSITTTDKLYLCPPSSNVQNSLTGFNGKLSKFQYFSKALSPSEIFNIYRFGPLV